MPTVTTSVTFTVANPVEGTATGGFRFGLVPMPGPWHAVAAALAPGVATGGFKAPFPFPYPGATAMPVVGEEPPTEAPPTSMGRYGRTVPARPPVITPPTTTGPFLGRFGRG